MLEQPKKVHIKVIIMISIISLQQEIKGINSSDKFNTIHLSFTKMSAINKILFILTNKIQYHSKHKLIVSLINFFLLTVLSLKDGPY
jgi:hypothetical protein